MKRHVPTLPVLLLWAFAAIGLLSCSRPLMTDEEASRWIAAYSPAHIDMDSKIRIEMTDFMAAKIDSAAPLAGCFDFSPSVRGKVELSADGHSIDFIPDKSLRQGRRYECRINMAELTGVDSLGDFGFDFVVDRRELRFKDVVATVDPDDISMMTVSGLLEFSVQGADSAMTGGSFIVCDRPDAGVTVRKTQSDGSLAFQIGGIKRLSEPSELTVSTNPMSGFSSAEEKLVIPAVEDFSLLNHERVEAAEPYINLDFSSVLSSTQELDGLISIDNVNDLKIVRDGCNVKVYYPGNGIADLTLRVSEMVRNSAGRCLDGDIELHFEQPVIPPAVEIPFDGNILPDDRHLELPFRAVNLAAVDVEVVEIFPSNVMSFLQENELHYTGSLRRYGRLIFRKTVRLDTDKSLDLHQWQNFSVDLKGLFRRERGAIYNVRISFRRAYSLYDRVEPENFASTDGVTADDEATWNRSRTYINREASDYDWVEYEWSDKDDPSKPTYYMVSWRMPERNLVASTLGMIVKMGDDKDCVVAVTDINNARPAAGIEVTAFNYQLRKIAHGVTDANGFVTLRPGCKPFMITATDGHSTTYQKMDKWHKLLTGRFDVSGKKVTDGVKGFTYGDRGVWRPGDELHLTLIVEDSRKALPKNHPVVMELYNPDEQMFARQTLTEGTDGFYTFHVPTDESVPTGAWDAQFRVGNQTFHHKVRIETIKPNRLKINLATPKVIMANRPQEIGLSARWLSGPVAGNLSATVDMELFADPAPFKAYGKYVFINPLYDFTGTPEQILTGRLDSLGVLKKQCTLGADANSPGMLRANLTAKVAEPGGDVSIVSRSVPFSPFGVYVGIDLADKVFNTDTDLSFPVVALNQEGQRMKTRELAYSIYRLDWSWWWEGSADALNRYVRSSSAEMVTDGTITVTNGKGTIPFRVNYPDWGRYLVLVRDIKGGHISGGVVNIDWPDWRGRADRTEARGSRELTFTLDKKSYEAGETASVYLPKCKGGRVLLSVENSSKVLKKFWVSTSADSETCFKLPVDASMAPNFYVSATLLRPHSETGAGVPIRLFGINGASVVDRRTILHPLIEMPEELHPQQTFTIKVREQDNKPMTYTLALVDEGLLDITSFRTPRPWVAMNQREAPGVDTWDMFDDVIGAFGGNFRSILSVGGDAALRKSAGQEKRFNPVVKFIGPVTLRSGVNTHRIPLPNYVGSVRVMVVAAHDGSYGNADKTVKVNSPLMLLTTLPRTLNCCDELEMPVNIFAMESGIGNVEVNVQTSGPVSVSGRTSQTLRFDSEGEKLSRFKLACSKKREGKARIVVTATGGGRRISDTTFIEVKNPMPLLTEVTDRTLKPGEETELEWSRPNTGNAALQIAAFRLPNFSGLLEFFGNYPHLCSEQLTSKALFMLYGRGYLDADGRRECEKLLPKVLAQICSRQNADGGFVYWPWQSESQPWVTSMAGLVLTEAERQGFRINRSCLEKWTECQEKAARNYRYAEATDLDQAFRLYSLAVAGKPMKSAMNRLRESKRLTQTAAFCLASAYGAEGRADVAAKLIERGERTPYTSDGGMFQSAERDDAIRLEAYSSTGNMDGALPLVRHMAESWSNCDYVTQDVAFAVMAIQSLYGQNACGNVSVKVTESGKSPLEIENLTSVSNIALNPASGKVTVKNTGKSNADLSLTASRRPLPVESVKASAEGIAASVVFCDLKGRHISADKLAQNTEFYAVVTVSGSIHNIDALAVTFAVPSGWEIWNNRLHGGGNGVDYCDIRDDKVIFYTALEAGQSRKFKVRLRACYPGRYVLPPVVCEDMYKPSCKANTSNSWVSVAGNI